jgi:4-amino-4-deoxy-L-arabinose transferase-like glycosyltransferase
LQIGAAFAAGTFAGLAIITRTSELIWLIPVFAIIWIFYARRLGFIKLAMFLAGIFLALIPIAYWNTILYQNPFRGGYNEMNRSLEEMSVASGAIVKSGIIGQIDVYRNYFQT